MPILPLAGPVGHYVQEPDIPPANGLDLSRFVDISRGEYRLRDTDGRYANMPNVRQRVVIMVREMTFPRKMTASFEADVTQRVRVGMRQLVDVEKRARLDGVIVERAADGVQGRASLLISYTDLTTNIRDEVRHEF